MSFTDVIHNFEPIRLQTSLGNRRMKRLRAFFQKFAILQQGFGVELQRLVHYERGKFDPEPDGMTLNETSFDGFFDRILGLSQIYIDYARDISSNVVEPLKETHQHALYQIRANETQVSGLQDAMHVLSSALTKEKVACQKALANYDKVKNNPTAGHSRVNSLFGSSNPDAPRLKAVEAVERYQSNLIAANSRKQRFHSVDMPSVMKQMQGLEENRLASSLTALRAYQYLTDSLNASVEACNEEMKILSLQLSPDKDIKTFIDRTIKSTGPKPGDWDKPFEYGLDRSLASLKTGSSGVTSPTSAGPSRTTLFHSTLEAVMTLQKEQFPDADIPQIVTALCQAVDDQGGFDLEGIFRISATVDERAELQKQLESGDYSIKTSSAHVPAGVLKGWLRDLHEPLIPYSVYDRSVSLGKEQTLEAKGQAILDEINAALPPLNRRVLDRILSMIQRVTVKQAINKMGPIQLGVVFAPGLLRPPADAPPMQIMNDAKYSAHFVVHLIQGYNRAHPLPPPSGGGGGGSSGGKPGAPPPPPPGSAPAPAGDPLQRKASRVACAVSGCEQFRISKRGYCASHQHFSGPVTASESKDEVRRSTLFGGGLRSGESNSISSNAPPTKVRPSLRGGESSPSTAPTLVSPATMNSNGTINSAPSLPARPGHTRATTIARAPPSMLGLNNGDNDKFATAPAALSPTAAAGGANMGGDAGDKWSLNSARGYSASISFALRNPGAMTSSGPTRQGSRPSLFTGESKRDAPAVPQRPASPANSSNNGSPSPKRPPPAVGSLYKPIAVARPLPSGGTNFNTYPGSSPSAGNSSGGGGLDRYRGATVASPRAMPPPLPSSHQRQASADAISADDITTRGDSGTVVSRSAAATMVVRDASPTMIVREPAATVVAAPSSSPPSSSSPLTTTSSSATDFDLPTRGPSASVSARASMFERAASTNAVTQPRASSAPAIISPTFCGKCGDLLRADSVTVTVAGT